MGCVTFIVMSMHLHEEVREEHSPPYNDILNTYNGSYHDSNRHVLNYSCGRDNMSRAVQYEHSYNSYTYLQYKYIYHTTTLDIISLIEVSHISMGAGIHGNI